MANQRNDCERRASDGCALAQSRLLAPQCFKAKAEELLERLRASAQLQQSGSLEQPLEAEVEAGRDLQAELLSAEISALHTRLAGVAAVQVERCFALGESQVQRVQRQRVAGRQIGARVRYEEQQLRRLSERCIELLFDPELSASKRGGYTAGLLRKAKALDVQVVEKHPNEHPLNEVVFRRILNCLQDIAKEHRLPLLRRELKKFRSSCERSEAEKGIGMSPSQVQPNTNVRVFSEPVERATTKTLPDLVTVLKIEVSEFVATLPREAGKLNEEQLGKLEQFEKRTQLLSDAALECGDDSSLELLGDIIGDVESALGRAAQFPEPASPEVSQLTEKKLTDKKIAKLLDAVESALKRAQDHPHSSPDAAEKIAGILEKLAGQECKGELQGRLEGVRAKAAEFVAEHGEGDLEGGSNRTDTEMRSEKPELVNAELEAAAELELRSSEQQALLSEAEQLVDTLRSYPLQGYLDQAIQTINAYEGSALDVDALEVQGRDGLPTLKAKVNAYALALGKGQVFKDVAASDDELSTIEKKRVGLTHRAAELSATLEGFTRRVNAPASSAVTEEAALRALALERRHVEEAADAFSSAFRVRRELLSEKEVVQYQELLKEHMPQGMACIALLEARVRRHARLETLENRMKQAPAKSAGSPAYRRDRDVQENAHKAIQDFDEALSFLQSKGIITAETQKRTAEARAADEGLLAEYSAWIKGDRPLKSEPEAAFDGEVPKAEQGGEASSNRDSSGASKGGIKSGDEPGKDADASGGAASDSGGGAANGAGNGAGVGNGGGDVPPTDSGMLFGDEPSDDRSDWTIVGPQFEVRGQGASPSAGTIDFEQAGSFATLVMPPMEELSATVDSTFDFDSPEADQSPDTEQETDTEHKGDTSPQAETETKVGKDKSSETTVEEDPKGFDTLKRQALAPVNFRGDFLRDLNSLKVEPKERVKAMQVFEACVQKYYAVEQAVLFSANKRESAEALSEVESQIAELKQLGLRAGAELQGGSQVLLNRFHHHFGRVLGHAESRFGQVLASYGEKVLHAHATLRELQSSLLSVFPDGEKKVVVSEFVEVFGVRVDTEPQQVKAATLHAALAILSKNIVQELMRQSHGDRRDDFSSTDDSAVVDLKKLEGDLQYALKHAEKPKELDEEFFEDEKKRLLEALSALKQLFGDDPHNSDEEAVGV